MLVWLSAIAFVTSIAALVVAILVARSAVPIALQRSMARVEARVGEFESNDIDRTANYAKLRTAVEASIEELEGLVETVEKKRRQTQGAANRLNGAQGQQQMDPEAEARIFFRSQGFSV